MLSYFQVILDIVIYICYLYQTIQIITFSYNQVEINNICANYFTQIIQRIWADIFISKNSIDCLEFDPVQKNVAISNQIWLLTRFSNISLHDDPKPQGESTATCVWGILLKQSLYEILEIILKVTS